MKLIILFLLLALTVTAQDSFTAKIETSHSQLFPGDEFFANFEIFNLGSNGREDVVLTYTFERENQILFSKSETIAIETQANVVRQITIPQDSKPGEYNLHLLVVRNNGQETQAFTKITVLDEKSEIYPYVIAVVLLIILMGFFIKTIPKIGNSFTKYTIKRKIKKSIRIKLENIK